MGQNCLEGIMWGLMVGVGGVCGMHPSAAAVWGTSETLCQSGDALYTVRKSNALSFHTVV